MINVGGLLFPDTEKHFTQFGDAVEEYGKPDRLAAYAYVKRWRRALDVGANVGIFARDFALRFEEVVAFEPMRRTRECLEQNVPGNVRIEPVAVANKPGVLQMYRTKASGGSFICNHPKIVTPEFSPDAKTYKVQVRTIDSFDFDAVDLIKLDIQGAEHLALLGARETILKHRPVVMVEEKPFSEAHAEQIKKTSKLLRKSFGMTAKEKVKTDRIYIFED
jgi:FkbM family methyltransferase